MYVNIFQKGFNYSQDGDGNRLVYHLQGCNMNCPWCANPEGMKAEGVIMEDQDWLLDSICPHGAINGRQVDRAVCAVCERKECVTQHKSKGMQFSCKEFETEEIIQEICECSPMFYDGGGVTFTGGEPTMQFESLKTILTSVKKYGIHTAIETNGTNPRLKELFPYIDQLIMDCKQCDEKKHKRATGISFEAVKKNIALAAGMHPRVHIRIPLIGDVNDSDQDLDRFIRFFSALEGKGITFEVLTYHEFGKNKWERCGFSYQMDQRAYVDERTVMRLKELMLNYGLHYEKT